MVITMTACIELLQEKATEEAQKWGKNFDKHSFHYEVKEVGVKYIFDNCNDPEYKQLLQDFNNQKSKLDERLKFLKSIKKPQTIVDENTGEVSKINPPVKTGKTSVTVELK